jgi:hypothetical protein
MRMEPEPKPEGGANEDRLPFSPAVGCLSSIGLGLLCAAGFFLLLWFNQQGQIAYAAEPYRAARVWLLRGVEGKGLGVSWTAPLPGATDEAVCARTTVRFLFVSGTVPESDAEFCECFTRSDGRWTSGGACPQ